MPKHVFDINEELQALSLSQRNLTFCGIFIAIAILAGLMWALSK